MSLGTVSALASYVPSYVLDGLLNSSAPTSSADIKTLRSVVLVIKFPYFKNLRGDQITTLNTVLFETICNIVKEEGITPKVPINRIRYSNDSI